MPTSHRRQGTFPRAVKPKRFSNKNMSYTRPNKSIDLQNRGHKLIDSIVKSKHRLHPQIQHKKTKTHVSVKCIQLNSDCAYFAIS